MTNSVDPDQNAPNCICHFVRNLGVRKFRPFAISMILNKLISKFKCTIYLSLLSSFSLSSLLSFPLLHLLLLLTRTLLFSLVMLEVVG